MSAGPRALTPAEECHAVLQARFYAQTVSLTWSRYCERLSWGLSGFLYTAALAKAGYAPRSPGGMHE